MADIITEGHQSRHYQRSWVKQIGSGPDKVVGLWNIGMLGVSLDAKAMVADVTESYQAQQDTPGWKKELANGIKPVVIHESNHPNRTWYIGPEGLMKWDTEPLVVSGEGAVSGGGRWRYLTDEEVEQTNLLHGHYELITKPHEEFLARDEGYNDHLNGTVDKQRMIKDEHYAKGVQQAVPEVVASGRRVVAPIGKELVAA